MELYIGTVEDRSSDPFRIARYKVRVVGLHSPLLSELPTEDLPWATPIQNNSAAISGVGSSATGYLQGSRVAIIFADEDLQIPLILGAIAGYSGDISKGSFDPVSDLLALIPAKTPPEDKVALMSGDIVPITQSAMVQPGATVIELPYIGTLTFSQVNQLKSAIALSESSNDYSKVSKPNGKSSGGFLGKYQLGAEALEESGYIVRGSYKKTKNNMKVVSSNTNWTGKDGITSMDGFLNSKSTQESAMDTMLKRNFTTLARTEAVSMTTPPEKVAGALMAAHLVGATGASRYIKKNDNGADANGTTAETYYRKGYASIIGISTNEVPTSENINSPAIDKHSDVATSSITVPKQSTGFTDPNGEYPLKSHINESDIPRLATGQKISETIVSEKVYDRDLNIPVANSTQTWNQSPIPYNAEYPFNQVYISESGHVLEFDDTSENERINLHHMSGTFLEIDNSGHETNKIVGCRTVIVGKDELVYIKGSGHVNIDGDLSIRIGQKCSVEIIGDANIKAANVNLEVSGDMKTKVDGNYSIHVGGAYNIESGSSSIKSNGASTNESLGTFNIRSGSMVNLDGIQIHLNDGLASGAVSVPISPIVYNTSNPIVVPKPTTQLESYTSSLEGPENVDMRTSLSDGVIPENEVPTVIADTTPKSTSAIISKKTTTCDFGTLSMSTQLSTNYKLSDLVKARGTPFPFGIGQNGLTDNEIACNLKKLCVNILEPLREKYSQLGMKINSGFRLGSGKSQHNLGQAADISFTTIRGIGTYKEQVTSFYNIAKEIVSMGLPIDQFIFETDPAQGTVWLHVSYNENANLPRTDGTGVMSFYGQEYIHRLELRI